MLNSEQQLVKTLKDSGYSSTTTRRAIFAALTRVESLTMPELVKSIGNSVDRASIYRTIDLFERLGIVQRVQIGWKYRLELSDTFSPHHHHIHCLSCGKITSLKEEAAIEQHIHHLAAANGFKLTAHQLELSGTCQNCQQKQK